MKPLHNLLDNFNIAGLKSSFEDEGAELDDVVDIVNLATRFNLKTTIKIGGCEAKTDILNCQKLGINNIVAPMVESSFAGKKFIDSIDEIYGDDAKNHDFYVNIESITAVNNAEEIILRCKDSLKGIVVGRSDLSMSLGLTKNETNSDILQRHTRHVLQLTKKYGLQTTVGGNLNSNGYEFVKTFYEEKLIDRIETRLVIVHVDERLMNNYQFFIQNAIELEKLLLEKRLKEVENKRAKISKRVNAITTRKAFLENVEKNEKSLLVVDFDNVVHEMTNGFHDGTIYGNPVPGTKEALKLLSEKYEIVIYTCKANPERPLINGKTGTELINEWLFKNDLKQHVSYVTFNKPNAIAYIDDKAVEFTTWEDCLKKLKQKAII